MSKPAIERLPTNTEAERFVLGALLGYGDRFPEAASILTAEDFSLESNRRVFSAMRGLYEAHEPIDTVNVANALRGAEALMPGGILAYLIELDTGMPFIPNLDSYARQVRDSSALRKICYAAHALMGQASELHADPTEILEKARANFLKLAEHTQESTLAAPSAIVEAGGGVDAYMDRRNRTPGLKCGFPGIDSMTGGFRPGALYVIGARPRMGKTALVLNFAEKVSVDRDAVTAIFSLEMPREALLDRLICSRSRVNTKRFEGGWMSRDEQGRAGRAIGEIAAADRILIDDKSTTSTQEIHAKIRRHAAKSPVGLVIIDYLQLMISGEAKYRVAETSRISRDLKLIAKDCKVPVIALSQLNRDCDTRDDHTPNLADLRESGAIEQDADLVAFLYRPEVYHKDREDLRGLADFIVAKQRSGPEGTVPLVWMNEFTRFEERESE